MLQKVASLLSGGLRLNPRGGEDGATHAYNAIDPAKPGIQCTFGVDKPMLARSHPFGIAQVSIASRESDQRAAMSWPGEQDNMPWPEGVRLIDRSIYETQIRALGHDGKMRISGAVFVLRTQPVPGAPPSETLRVLLDLECHGQAVAYLGGLLGTSDAGK